MGRKFSATIRMTAWPWQAYNETTSRLVREIHPQFPKFRERMPQIIGNADLLRNQELLESSTWTRFQKDLGGTLLAWEALERDHTPFPEPLMRETMAHIQTPVLREAVARRQDFYTANCKRPSTTKGSAEKQRHRNGPGLTDGNEILQRILAPIAARWFMPTSGAGGAARAGTCVTSSRPSKKP